MEIPSARWPATDRQKVRDLIRRMSIENPLWGAPKIHGELLKLGIDVARSTVSIYMVPRQGRPLQTRKIFLRNHVEKLRRLISLSFRRLPFGSYSQRVLVWSLPQSSRGAPRPSRRAASARAARSGSRPFRRRRSEALQIPRVT